MSRALKTIAVAVGLIGAVAGSLEYFARASVVKEIAQEQLKKADNVRVDLLAQRLDQQIQFDKIDRLQQRMWVLEDRHKPKPLCDWPQTDRDEYRRLVEDKRRAEASIPR